MDDGYCILETCGYDSPFPGEAACNYNPDANEDNGRCGEDCLGVCGGDAYIDPCGYCDSNPENDCAVECAAIIEQLSIEEEIQCENGITGGGYNCNDLNIILDIMNSNLRSLSAFQYTAMDVDNNNIVTVYEYGQQQWDANGRLTSLDLSYNENVVVPTSCNFRLRTLPDNIGNLSALKKLSLINNEITSLPESITNLDSLKQLLLESNQLTSLPENFGKLTNLKELNLSSNQIEQLPMTIGNLILLEKLWASNNQLADLPESIANLSKLQWLYLNNNNLTSLPESIANLESLIIFNVDDNNLFSLPESLCCQETESLCCEICCETDGSCFYDGMQSFSINNNYICSDSLEYAYPLCLGTILKNGGRQLCNDCPPNYFMIEGYCAWEADYDILQNFLELNPGSIEEGLIPIHAYGAENPDWWEDGRLVEITFPHKELNSILPENIGDLDKLEILRLTGNELKGAIPDNITNLDNLKILKLSSNNLSENIPIDIGELKKLDTLFLSYNNLTGEIPSSVIEIDSLTYLDLNNNNLSGLIPEYIGSLDNLRYLYLYDNDLEGEIPSSIGNLTNLKRLYLYNNNLSDQIPESICNIYTMNASFNSTLDNNQLCPPYPACIPESHIKPDSQDCSP